MMRQWMLVIGMMTSLAVLGVGSAAYAGKGNPIEKASIVAQSLMKRYLANPTPQAFNAAAPALSHSARHGGQVSPSQLQSLAGLIQGNNSSAIQMGALLMGAMNQSGQSASAQQSDYLGQALGGAAQTNPNAFLQSLQGIQLPSGQLDSLMRALPRGLSVNGGDLTAQLNQLKMGSLQQLKYQVQSFVSRMKFELKQWIARVKASLR